jgi:hypothetical protein
VSDDALHEFHLRRFQTTVHSIRLAGETFESGYPDWQLRGEKHAATFLHVVTRYRRSSEVTRRGSGAKTNLRARSAPRGWPAARTQGRLPSALITPSRALHLIEVVPGTEAITPGATSSSIIESIETTRWAKIRGTKDSAGKRGKTAKAAPKALAAEAKWT